MSKTKKIFLYMSIMIAISASSLFATIDFGKNDAFRLDFAPVDPLYKESLAYPFSNTFRFNYMISPKTEENVANTILVSADDGGSPSYKKLAYKDMSTHNTKFWGLKSCVNIGLLRLTYKDIVSVEGYIHGGINTVFGAYGGVDCLGFDGQYGAGLSALFLDSIALRAGFHHYSGHWGDEILNDFYSRGYTSTDYKTITEYTRNNSWFLGLSYDLLGYVRLAFDAELPMANSWIRPAAHVPGDTTKPSSEESPEDANTAEHIWEQEGFPDRDNHHYPSSYKAWRIGLSVEAQYPVKNIGRVYATFDLQLHQDGKIDIATADYDETLPWRKEYSAVIGIALQDRVELPEVCVELGYHNGRFPLLNYWFQDIEYFSVGIGLTL